MAPYSPDATTVPDYSSRANLLKHATKHPRMREAAICLVLCSVTLAAYSSMVATPNQFLMYDDVGYVTGNPAVKSGINLASLRWAATAVVTDNWHPLTMLSHMLDVELFGLESRWHHAVSLLIHVANTVLVFFVLRAMTGAVWRSALVAALFSWHPLRVESVAWLAERKDVLSTFFWLLALAAYTAYARRGGWKRYVLVAVLFVLALLAKPMPVTLPLLLLLIDYWPLGRVPENWWSTHLGRQTIWRLCWEKLSLLAIAGAFIATTLATQSSRNLESMPDLATRIGQSGVSYCEYLANAFWPTPLYLPYLYAERDYHAAVGFAAIAAISLVSLATIAARRRRYLAVGWFWFLGTLVPVIGLVQVGAQSIADRYTYVPLIGLYIIAAWFLGELAPRHNVVRAMVWTGITIVLTWFVALTAWQVPVWYDTSTLFAHTIHHSPKNHIAHDAYGSAELAKGHYVTAIEHYEIAVEVRPDMYEPTINLARVHQHLGETEESLHWFRRAIVLQPANVSIQAELARLLASGPDPVLRDGQEAEQLAYAASSAYGGQNPAMLDILAMAHAAQGDFTAARATATQALRLALARQQAGDLESGRIAPGIAERLQLYRRDLPYVSHPTGDAR